VKVGPGLGAIALGDDRCRFRVWAPKVEVVQVRLLGRNERLVALDRDQRGYHEAIVEGVGPGQRYLYRLDGGEERPDPASRLQPQGVHGPSEVVSSEFAWTDVRWKGLPLSAYILYEVHVGAFSSAGDFGGVVERLDDLVDLGVTALELMPVAQFPGSRNWGYDGVYPFAVQESYGGPRGLRELVDACHGRGVAVVLDVVYNHLGPEGNYLGRYGPYFSNRYLGPWGPVLDFDGPSSDEVRDFFFQHALYFLRDFHIDALRIDAIHGIYDFSARPFLLELAELVHELANDLGRQIYLIAESDLNDARIVRPPEQGGYGLDAQWSDDFHHALHTLLTGERDGYYRDFGGVEDLVCAFSNGFVYCGQQSAFRGRRHGNCSKGIPTDRFVVFAQNHDQVGNRMGGERLGALVSFEQLKLAAAAVLLSPYVPLLFMGEEFGEVAPFAYFVSHSDEALVEAVRRGRRQEFAAFAWGAEPPDPRAELTFRRATLDHSLRQRGKNATLREFYRTLIALRHRLPSPGEERTGEIEAGRVAGRDVLWVRRNRDSTQTVLALNFAPAEVLCVLPLGVGQWGKLLDSAEERWAGPGSPVASSIFCRGMAEISLPPFSAVLFSRSGA